MEQRVTQKSLLEVIREPTLVHKRMGGDSPSAEFVFDLVQQGEHD